MFNAKSTSMYFLLIGRAKTWFGLVALCLALAWGPAAAAWAETPDDAARELRGRLHHVLDQQEESQAALEKLQRELARLDLEMAQAEEESRQLGRQAREIAERLPEVRQEVRELAPQVRRLRALYARHLRALYLFGPEASQSLLASAVDFHDVLARSQAFTWLLEADHRHLERLAERSRRLGELQALLAWRQNEVQEVASRLEEQQQRLLSLRQARLAAAEQLKKRQQALDLSLAALKEAEARLARTFTLPAEEPPRASGRPAGTGNILEAKGSLALPVEGRVLSAPGPGARGVVIQAQPGSPVRSPWAGTVVHASYLAGYGRVVVVDHGERVHTVLAHLGPLSVEAGQVIKAGQTLGAVDENGRLYLEVRREARPENPLEWLRLGP